MTKLVREVSDLANEILESQWQVKPVEALQIAVKIQHNRILEDAYMVNKPTGSGTLNAPSALEFIGMQLETISDSIHALDQ